MCVVFYALDHFPDLRLLVAFNRDEILDRPTAPAHVWPGTSILGGRDLARQGTWLCLDTATCRAAWLTNFRDRSSAEHVATGAAPSRGALPVLAATGAEPPLDALARIGLQDFPGFNLVLADLARGEAALLCNRAPQAVRRVAPGLHGLSNGHTWPKVAAGVAALEALAATGAFDAGAVPWEEVFRLMSDDRELEADPARLPQTGYGDEFEAAASGIFVRPIPTALGAFGTRSQTVLAVWRDGWAELRERSRGAGGGGEDGGAAWEEVRHRVKLELTGERQGDKGA